MLPVELLLKIFALIDSLADLLSGPCLVSRRWAFLARDYSLYVRIDLSYPRFARSSSAERALLTFAADGRLRPARALLLAGRVSRVFDDDVARCVFAAAPRVEVADLSMCRLLGDAGLRAIAEQRPPLRELRLSGCTAVGADGVGAVVCALAPTLRTLHACRVAQLDLAAVAAATARCGVALEELALARLPQLTTPALAALLSPDGIGAALTALNVAACAGVDDDTLRVIGRACGATLQRLWVGATGVTARGLVHVATPRLCWLDVTECDGVDDAALAVVAEQAGALRALRCKGCRRVGDDGLDAIARAAPRSLRELEVSGCSRARVTSRGVAAVVAACPRLRCVGLHGLPAVDGAAVVQLAGPVRPVVVASPSTALRDTPQGNREWWLTRRTRRDACLLYM